VKKTIVGVVPLSDAVAAVKTCYELLDAAAHLITRWEHAYLIRETEAGLRPIAAIADNELAAWNARGTPLGSSSAPTP
jgi:hypothetical protein